METKNQIFLAGCIVWGIIAAMASFFYSIPQQSEISLQQYEQIKTSVFNETQIAEYDLSQIIKVLNQGETIAPFQQLNFKTKYPCFIFKQKKMIFWSDYAFVPQYNDLEGNYRFRLLNLRGSLYIVLKSKEKMRNKEEFEFYSLIPIFTRYKIENQYLKPHYNTTILPFETIVVLEDSTHTKFKINAPSSEYLFTLKPIKNPKNNYFLWYAFVISAINSLISLGLLVHFRFIIRFANAKKLGYGYVFWLLYTAIALAIIAYKQWLAPAHLWLLLALWTLFLVIYWLSVYRYLSPIRYFLQSPPNISYGLATACLGLVYFVQHAYFETIAYIFIQQQVSLDFTKSIDIDNTKLLYLVIITIISFVFILIIHIFIRLSIKAFDNAVNFLYALLIALLTYGIFIFWQQKLITIPIAFALSLYIVLAYFWRLPKFLYSFKYLSSIYFFTSAILCAFIGAIVIFYTEDAKQVTEKRNFAIQLLGETDALVETQLKEVVKQLKRDTILPNFWRDTATNKTIIENRINLEYLKRYFDNYQATILLFNATGKSIDNPKDTSATYTYYYKKYAKIYFQTDSQDVYFIDNLTGNLVKQYVAFVEIRKKNTKIGYLIIDLTQKKTIPNNVYPTLLVDKKFVQSSALRSYSYAIFSDNKLNYSYGECNYETQFSPKLFDNSMLFDKGISFGNFKHFALEGGSQKRIVVSSAYYSIASIFTNFSFLFLLFTSFLAITLLGYSTWHKFKGFKVNFATRIQFYLNLAFFLPLIIVSLATLNVISNTYQKDFEEQFIEKTESVSNNIEWHYENFKNGTMSKDKFTDIFTQLAQYVEVDMNIFDAQGLLVLSNQPAIYENNGLLSKYINPWAYKAIVIEKKKNIMLSENVGLLNFKSVYVPIKSYQKGTIEGVLSIPFFDAKFQLETKKRESLAIILNIFTAVFLIFLAISYFASRILTVPLRLITYRIRKTTFSDYNQPLEWNSNDEIGLFVEEFNKMLRKLDASKDALARSQMENAWREIAKQVAHEIKNPLMPIKLTIQHMQMRLQNQPEKIQVMFERSFETLLAQVDVLDDIATSFSAFAKMPVPENERFDLAAVMRDIEILYLNNEDIDFSASIPQEELYIMADRKLTIRIATNLVKNAIESVPKNRKPIIRLSLEKTANNRLLLKITDNGMGIPKNLQDRIFIPNFTTKTTGSGIGLSVSKHGIEQAGGLIWFETEIDKGTTFFVELPLLKD